MIKMRWQLAAGSILVAALMTGAFFLKQPGITFDRLPDAKARLIAAGFLCTADSIHGQAGTGFLISRAPVSWATLVPSARLAPWAGVEGKGLGHAESAQLSSRNGSR
jgi:hypothetical protein